MTIKTKNNLKSVIELPKPGQLVEGKIINIEPSAIYIDLGPIGTGIIYGREYYIAKDYLRHLKVGDQIKAKIIEIDNQNGYLELSVKEAEDEFNWVELKRIKDEFKTIKIKIAGANKGGLLASYKGIKGFLPLSQLSMEHYPRVEEGNSFQILQHLQKFIGQEWPVKIIEASGQENKLIFSEKAVESKKIQEFLKNYKVGDIVEGEITGLADFGAFIKFPLNSSQQVEGLIHISELGWQLITDPAKLVKVGQKVKAKIVNITKEGRVSLSLKALTPDPWLEIEKKIKKGDIISGKVTKIDQFGAFVEISPTIRGLAHISEFDNSREKINAALKVGKTYKFKVLLIDPQEHKLSLSLAK